MSMKILSAALALSAIVSAGPLRADPGDPVVRWAVDRMSEWSPPGKYAYLNETKEEALARYAEIASAARDVAFDPQESPLFQGPDGRSRTMSVLLAVASVESGGFQRSVDLGIGNGVGDGGKSWCLMQVRLSEASKSTKRTWYRIVLDGAYFSYAYGTDSGWGGEDLVADRTKCFRAGLHMVRKSFDVMASRPLEDRLSVYASGRPDLGLKASRRRMAKAVEWLTASPPPVQDHAVLKMLKAVPDVGS